MLLRRSWTRGARRYAGAVALITVLLVAGSGSALPPSPGSHPPQLPSPAATVSLRGALPAGAGAPDPVVTFSETGLPQGTQWKVSLENHLLTSKSGKIRFSEPAGEYYWGVTTSPAFTVAPAPAGIITVHLLPVNITLKFARATTPHPIQHVVVIVLENEGASDVAKWGTYENYLAHHYGRASQFYAACHHSAPNYLAMISAETNQCNNSAGISDGYHTYDNTTLGDLLQRGGFTWGQFVESLPLTFNCLAPGTPGSTGLFALQHVPFAFFRNSTTSPPPSYGANYCAKHIESSKVFQGSGSGGVNSTSFVNFSFYTPNLCDDGHNRCTTSPKCPSGNTACDEVRQADTWLKNFLGPLLNGTGRYADSPQEKKNVAHTAFLIAYDESANPTSYAGYAVRGVDRGNTYRYCLNSSNPQSKGDAVCGGLVPLIVVGPVRASGEKMTLHTSPFSVAATVEWLFNLGGPHGTGMDNPGHFDASYRWVGQGFPTFEWLLGISSNGYSARN
jgi:hypothetical protein